MTHMYSKEVDSIMLKINSFYKNSPLERTARYLAAKQIKTEIGNDSDMTAEKKRIFAKEALSSAREAVGAKKDGIIFSDDELKALANVEVVYDVLNRIKKSM